MKTETIYFITIKREIDTPEVLEHKIELELDKQMVKELIQEQFPQAEIEFHNIITGHN